MLSSTAEKDFMKVKVTGNFRDLISEMAKNHYC